MLEERGGSRPSAVSSYAAATSASSSIVSGRPAGASRRSTRRHSGDRSASRPTTRSSNRPVNDESGQLAPGCEQLLGDERDATAPFRHEDERRAGGPLPLDPFDEVGQLTASERFDPESLGGPPRIGHGDDVAGERMGTGQLVRLVRRDEADPVGSLDLGEERGERPRAGVGVVDVLEDQHHRLPFAQPPEDAEDPLEHPGLAALGRGDARPLRHRSQSVEADVELRHQPEVILDARAEERDEVIVRHRLDDRPQGPQDRCVRLVGAGRDRATAQDGERLGEGGEAGRRLGQEAADPDAAAALGENRGRDAGLGGLEGRGEPRERRIRAPRTARS